MQGLALVANLFIVNELLQIVSKREPAQNGLDLSFDFVCCGSWLIEYRPAGQQRSLEPIVRIYLNNADWPSGFAFPVNSVAAKKSAYPSGLVIDTYIVRFGQTKEIF